MKKRNLRRGLALALCVVMAISMLVLPAAAEGESKPTVWIVGDSTACDYPASEDGDYKFKRCGFGTALKEYIDSTAYDVQNLAIKGESSKSFLSQGNYATMTSGIKAGDVLIIAWGHNDENNEAAKYTNPNGDYTVEGSFAKSLYDNYVKVAQDANAYPILCTPIVRRSTSNDYSGERAHITTTSGEYEGGDYPAVIRTLGETFHVPVVDMTDLTKAKWSSDGPEVNVDYHAYTSSLQDNTHLNNYGAHVVAQILATELAKLTTAQAGGLAAAVDPNAVQPDKATQLVQNEAWVDPATIPYAPPTDEEVANSGWPDYVAGESGVKFHGAVFGQLSGDFNASNYKLETDESDNMHIQSNAKSKIQSGDDGMVMYYYRVNAEDTFELSAEVKLNSLVSNSQAAFGLVARDDMYINKSKAGLNSDYVAAGTFGTGTYAAIARLATFQKKMGTLPAEAAAGDVYTLKLVRSADNFTCTVNGVTTTFDTKLGGPDTAYDYIGMFVSREVDATFRNIVLKVNGVELCNTTRVVPFAFTINGWGFQTAEGAESTMAVEGGKLASVHAVQEGEVPQGAMAMAAVYNLNGKMTGLKVLPIQNGDIPVGLKMNGGETAKVFLLDGNTLAPMLTEPFSKTSGQPPADPDAPEGRIKVWDFAGVDEADTEIYENMVTLSILTDAGIGTDGNLTKEYNINGVTYQDTSGRLYSTVSGWITNGTNKYGQTTFDDGYVSKGGIYVGGAGNASKRYLIIRDVEAGDKIVAYMGSTNGEITYYAGTVTADTQSTTDFTAAPIEGGNYERRDFIAKETGDFKIWSSTGKGFFCRVKVLKPAEVTGTITLTSSAAGLTGYGLTFLNLTTNEETVATLTGNTFSAKLVPGYEYVAVLTGVSGYGFTNASKRLTIADADSVTGKADVALAVESKETYTYTGSVTGFAAGYDTSGLKITLTPDPVSAGLGALPETPTVTGTSFTDILEPGVTYTVSLEGVNDYEIVSGGTVANDDNAATLEQNIVVALKPTYAASGSFVTLEEDDQFAPLYEGSAYPALAANAVTALTFTNVDDEYTYPATVTATGYSADLRAGAYLATATAGDYTTQTHVVVGDKAVTKDLMFVSTATPEAVDYAANVYVGDETQTLNFKTVTGAMAYIKRMNRPNDERVTVHIAPGTYREQINVDSANVTFVGTDPTAETKLTWYYGIGYTYYSSDGSWYSPQKAFDRYDKAAVARWGCTVRLEANGFQAENITFENSFNYAVTDEELADGVELLGNPDVSKITAARTYALDVTSKAATERAAAIWMDSSNNRSDKAEFKNCRFLSSQDTLGTGDRAYFKDCYIEGMTDYICGPGSVVLDTCQLNWKGYSDDSTSGGYITAPQTKNGGKSTEDVGYLFRGCYVSADSKWPVPAGGWCRMWGGADTAATFLNTVLASADLISAAPWNDMGNGTAPADALYLKEYGTTLPDGTAVAPKGPDSTKMTADEAAAVDPAVYFGDWTPEYYVAESETVGFESAPTLFSNTDMNAPTPGNTLSVGYSLGAANDANDVSRIQWFAVKDGQETLLKSSVANVDKTYQIQSTDTGSKIKVTVTPATISGATAAAQSATSDNAVGEGYYDPNDDRDPTLGDGVNIFLAGDSTVKDYSTINDGKGSWGEYLQEFFDTETVTVVNYANGGRSTRNFINEGSLDKIEQNIKAGDYLFIQFGHNDCYEEDMLDRYVAVGTPDENGIYPTTAAQKYATPSGLSQTLKDRYGAQMYTWDVDNDGTTPNGTFKWYLQQYIDVAKSKGATPVLITPVSRMNYDTDGTIKPHHDDSKSSNNAYVTAMKQLGQENGVQVIDGFELTKGMLETAATAAKTDNLSYETYGKQVLCSADSTHYNKLGGMLTAAIIAGEVQKVDWNIAKTVHAPAGVSGAIIDGATVFTITNAGKLTAYDILTDYTDRTAYWEGVGQNLFDAIQTKAAELNSTGGAG